MDFIGDGPPDIIISADIDSQEEFLAGAVYIVDGHKIGEGMAKRATGCSS